MYQNLGGLFDQAKKLKENMEIMREELAGKKIEVVAGDQEVKVVINGLQEVTEIIFAQGILAPENQEHLQALLKHAVNQGLLKSRELAGTEITSYTGFDPSSLADLFNKL